LQQAQPVLAPALQALLPLLRLVSWNQLPFCWQWQPVRLPHHLPAPRHLSPPRLIGSQLCTLALGVTCTTGGQDKTGRDFGGGGLEAWNTEISSLRQRFHTRQVGIW
jgi:hypothetical protein